MKHVDLNQAGVFDLEAVFHDRQRAQEVLNMRELLGNYRDWEDLQQRVHGISDHLIKELSSAGATIGSGPVSPPRPRARPRPKHHARI